MSHSTHKHSLCWSGLLALLLAGTTWAAEPTAAPPPVPAASVTAPAAAAAEGDPDPQRSYESLPRYGASYFATPTAGEAVPAAGTEAGAISHVPVPADYTLGAGDALSVRVWAKGWEQVTQTVTVSPEGTVTLPEIGNVTAAGLTLGQLREVLTTQYRKLYDQATVTVVVPEQRTIEVFITGDATRPGRYLLVGMPTVLTALYACGGPSAIGSYRDVQLRRAGRAPLSVDLYRYLLQGDRTQDVPLLPGDVLFIPPLRTEVGFSGEVRRPARYEIRAGMTLGEALEQAGGLKPSAYAPTLQLWRSTARREWQLLNVSSAETGAPGLQQPLQDGDLVIVQSLLAYGTNTVYLTGAVKRPGDYPVTAGVTRLSEVLWAAQGLTGDAHMGTGVLRRRDAQRHYTLTNFRVDDLLAGKADADLILQPHDVIQFFHQSEVERAFEVSVEGAVVRPGKYPWVENLRVNDLLLEAGGLAPQAYRSRATVVRINADQQYQQLTVDLAAAASGAPEANLVLQRGDVLSVRLRAEVEGDAKVKIDGFVRTPGDYPRREGMKVSDLIFAAGGLTPGAGPHLELARGGYEGTPDTLSLTLLETPAGYSVMPDVVLLTGDAVGVAGRGDFQQTAELVRLQGRVAQPGSYALKGHGPENRYTIRDLIKESGGLLPDANLAGLVIYRRYDATAGQAQATDLAQVLQFVNQEAKQPPLQLASQNQQMSAMGSTVAQGLQSVLSSNNSVSIVLPPRPISPEDRVAAIPVDGPKALNGPDGSANLELESGDVVVVPRRINLVTVLGAVPRPGSVPYVTGESARAYLNHSGGLREDAAGSRLIVVHPNGAVSPLGQGDAIQPGDVIVVPAKYIVRTVHTENAWQDWLAKMLPIITAALVF
ncbi:MAG TPA: SLBB domain-containing protein [Armatimonadota bacterium]|jgi:protein involved in polysaccharide export with SLBB domain